MNFYAELKHYHEMMKTSRKAMGYTIGNDQHYITAFIEFCEDSFPSAAQITQEMVDSWLCSYDFRKPKTQSNAVSLLRTYCRFLRSIGVQCYIPDDDHTIRCPKYHPYIFTDTELVSLFHAFDTIQPHPYGPNREYIFPVLFRMMYCCGMRPTEPLRLKTEDVNLHTGEIYIRQSKQNKDRHIMMSGDMKRLCQRYDAAMGKREWFFQKWDDGPFTGEWARNQMDRCWKTTGLVKRQNLRPYDLRHNFATRSIMKWVDNGDDVMTLLPYLGTYMGHTKFTHTLYYVHLLPERLRNSSNIDWDMFRGIYGREEAENDED